MKNKLMIIGITVLVLIASIGLLLSKEGMTVNEHINLAYQDLQEGQYEKALMSFQAVIEKDENNNDAKMGLAEVYHETGYPEKSIKIYEEIIQRVPMHVFAYSKLGEILLEEGYIYDAIDILKKGYEQTGKEMLEDQFIEYKGFISGQMHSDDNE